jgi:hypothetical protein
MLVFMVVIPICRSFLGPVGDDRQDQIATDGLLDGRDILAKFLRPALDLRRDP